MKSYKLNIFCYITRKLIQKDTIAQNLTSICVLFIKNLPYVSDLIKLQLSSQVHHNYYRAILRICYLGHILVKQQSDVSISEFHENQPNIPPLSLVSTERNRTVIWFYRFLFVAFKIEHFGGHRLLNFCRIKFSLS